MTTVTTTTAHTRAPLQSPRMGSPRAPRSPLARQASNVVAVAPSPVASLSSERLGSPHNMSPRGWPSLETDPAAPGMGAAEAAAPPAAALAARASPHHSRPASRPGTPLSRMATWVDIEGTRSPTPSVGFQSPRTNGPASLTPAQDGRVLAAQGMPMPLAPQLRQITTPTVCHAHAVPQAASRPTTTLIQSQRGGPASARACKRAKPSRRVGRRPIFWFSCVPCS